MRKLGLGLTLAVWACGGSSEADDVAPQTLPLPVTMVLGQEVMVLPLTLLSAQQELGWADSFPDRVGALRMADSIIADALTARAPEVNWVLPERLVEFHRRNPTVLPDPHRMAGAVLRGERVEHVPDPLRGQLRTMSGFAGGRFVMVPAALFFTLSPQGIGRAQLSVVIADVRTGRVMFRTIGSGDGDAPWTALRRALRALVPEQL